MDNITEIKEKLNAIYKEYKDNKSQLNGEKTKNAAKLIVEMTFSDNGNPSDVAAELARFSADIVKVYFESITKSVTIPLEVLDEVLKEWYSTDKDPKLSQHYVQKYVFAVTAIIRNYKDQLLTSTQLPRLVAFIASYAVKNDFHRKKFKTLITDTNGEFFNLDYSNINNNSLLNVLNATNSVLPDLPKGKYESFITEWAAKYGFTTSTNTEKPVSTDNNMKTEESVVTKETPKEETPAAGQPPVKTKSVNPPPNKEEPKTPVTNDTVSEKNEKPTAESVSTKDDTPAGKTVANADEKATDNTSESTVSEKKPAQKSSIQILHERIKRDMDKEQEAIIAAFVDKIKPIGKAVESIQGEINKSRELGIENATLKSKNSELERQLAEMRTRLQENGQLLSSAKVENSNLRQQVATLESKIAELDGKLNDVYSINSRESSLEAERVRAELKKAFSRLYETWLEYEFSDVNEDNYATLQAIINKTFRSLEMNGIDFKGNN